MIYKFLFLCFCAFFVFLVSPVNAVPEDAIENGDFFYNYSGWTRFDTYSGTPTYQTIYWYELNATTHEGYIRFSAHHGAGSCGWMQTNLSQEVDFTNVDTLYIKAKTPKEYDFIIYNSVDSLKMSAGNLVSNRFSYNLSWDVMSFDVSSLSGVHTLTIEFYSQYLGSSDNKFRTMIDVDWIRTDGYLPDGAPPPPSANGTLFLELQSSNQYSYINGSLYPTIPVYYHEFLDWTISDYNTSCEYFINCSSSRDNISYDSELFCNQEGAYEYDTFDQPVNLKFDHITNILYPSVNDTPTVYTFHLYELYNPEIVDLPWWYFFIEPLYTILNWFSDSELTTITELDSISVSLGRPLSNESSTPPPLPPDDPVLPDDPIIPDDPPDDSNDPDPPDDPDVPDVPPSGPGANETLNSTWINGYYDIVNSSVGGFFNPIYNFTAWTLQPVNDLNNTVCEFNTELNNSLDTAGYNLDLLSSSLTVIFEALPDKIKGLISYYLCWVIFLILLKGRK